MLIELKIDNAFVFNKEETFSMLADKRILKLASNCHTVNNDSVIKSACIYGPNNSGKTCFVKVLRALRSIILNEPFRLESNLFSSSPVVKIGVIFIQNLRKWSYKFHYDVSKKEFIYESFSEVVNTSHNNESNYIKFVKDTENKDKNKCEDTNILQILDMIGNQSILINSVNIEKSKIIKDAYEILRAFALNIEVVSMNNIPINKTIDTLKQNVTLRKKIASFVRNADVFMDDFGYSEKIEIKASVNTDKTPDERVLKIGKNLEEQLHLYSIYRGITVPSILFDSTGTKKLSALSSYVIEALQNGKILIVDELDSGLHFRITRAIVSMFNNDVNENAQLIFTAHDISLLDCKKLFRKEQIWFINKDIEGVDLYSLSEFTAIEGFRDTTDYIEKYKKGLLGAVPNPKLIESLLEDVK